MPEQAHIFSPTGLTVLQQWTAWRTGRAEDRSKRTPVGARCTSDGVPILCSLDFKYRLNHLTDSIRASPRDNGRMKNQPKPKRSRIKLAVIIAALTAVSTGLGIAISAISGIWNSTRNVTQAVNEQLVLKIKQLEERDRDSQVLIGEQWAVIVAYRQREARGEILPTAFVVSAPKEISPTARFYTEYFFKEITNRVPLRPLPPTFDGQSVKNTPRGTTFYARPTDLMPWKFKRGPFQVRTSAEGAFEIDHTQRGDIFVIGYVDRESANLMVPVPLEDFDVEIAAKAIGTKTVPMRLPISRLKEFRPGPNSTVTSVSLVVKVLRRNQIDADLKLQATKER